MGVGLFRGKGLRYSPTALQRESRPKPVEGPEGERSSVCPTEGLSLLGASPGRTKRGPD